MKIGIAVDNTLGLHVPSFVDFVRRHAPTIECHALTSRFHLSSDEIEYEMAVKELSPEIKAEMSNYDLSLLITATPYSNNYFYTGAGGIFIVSLSDWKSLTMLPMSNGIAYLLCEIIVGHMGVGEQHNENIGCVNDFLWEKTGIDVGMRAAYICRDCRSRSHGNPFVDSPDFKGITAILDAISSASRRDSDILLEPVIVPVPVQRATFLCHNSVDKSQIRHLNGVLKNAMISTWFDEDLPPGVRWQRELQKAIPSIGCSLVIVGDSGIGPWQELEIEAFLSAFVKRGCKIIPVLIGNAASAPELPIFLGEITWVDLRTNDHLQLARLIAALKPP